MKNIAWIKDLTKKTESFLNEISENNYNYIRYSLSGDIYKKDVFWGLGQNVFMVKILYMLGLLGNIIPEKKLNLEKNILKFQDNNGYISDPLIIKLTSRKKLFFLKSKVSEFEMEKIKRAETRQSFSALNCLGEKPTKPFLHIPYTEKDIDKFLSSFDWQLTWGAGSHFSHLLFFLRMNAEMFKYGEESVNKLIDYANYWIDNLQSKKDGFWYTGETTVKEKINGAMKILTGKTAAGISNINYHELIIDGCLDAINDKEACSNFNIIYCLYYCSKISDYRKKDIEKFCCDRLAIYKDFYFESIGGFSFYRNKANDIYYGAKITRGLNEPDIHGTVMFLWGISIISKILRLEGCEFNLPLT